MAKKQRSKAVRIVLFLLVIGSMSGLLVLLGILKIGKVPPVRPGEGAAITDLPGVYFAAASLFAVAGILIAVFVIGAEGKGKKKWNRKKSGSKRN
ncbi:MAG: hypothetical protein ACYS47_18725 [Planctomycetota bacterium]|jgi:hypothetical protein